MTRAGPGQVQSHQAWKAVSRGPVAQPLTCWHGGASFSLELSMSYLGLSPGTNQQTQPHTRKCAHARGDVFTQTDLPKKLHGIQSSPS